ncbi:transcription factor steA-like [Thrips palmi]|uniref:Transcription factor steA-like n=1 Tax=Thrips palmi TaxID=161013 RepID=A0A6P8ZX67_THRPL|nr:transcription factor steA-like [Thrips palmi]
MPLLPTQNYSKDGILSQPLQYPLPPGLIVEPRPFFQDAVKPTEQERNAEVDDETARSAGTAEGIPFGNDAEDVDFVDIADSPVMGIIGDLESREESNTCETCGKVYQHRRHLQRHVKYECSGRRAQFQCPICFKTYKRPEHLKRHGLLIHRVTINTPRKKSS